MEAGTSESCFDLVLHKPNVYYFHVYLQDAYEEELQIILLLCVLPAVRFPTPVYGKKIN